MPRGATRAGGRRGAGGVPGGGKAHEYLEHSDQGKQQRRLAGTGGRQAGGLRAQFRREGGELGSKGGGGML